MAFDSLSEKLQNVFKGPAKQGPPDVKKMSRQRLKEVKISTVRGGCQLQGG